jgi:hypothetical protein
MQGHLNVKSVCVYNLQDYWMQFVAYDTGARIANSCSDFIIMCTVLI